jgi:hypothetical protein
MTLVTQVLVCFHTIRHFPGLTLEELGEKIGDLYGHMYEVKFLVHGGDYSFMADRIHEINCVEVRNGRYYYNKETKPYSKDSIFNACIEMQMMQEEQIKKDREKYPDP